MRSLYANLTQYAKLLSKHLQKYFKQLLGMELAPNVVFLAPSSVNSDFFIYVFATNVDCEIRYVGTAKLKNIPYIIATVTCTIKLRVKRNLGSEIKDLDVQVPGREKISKWK